MSSVDPKAKELLDELIDAVSEESTDAKKSDESVNLSSDVSASEFTEMSETTVQKDSTDNETKSSSGHQKRFIKKKLRSVSESESEIESQSKNIRRKFGSEGEILSICEKIFPPQKQKELNEAIEEYIGKLIKDSIFKAVANVNVNNLYENIISNISNHESLQQNVESEEEYVVEQRLSSDSISELVELHNVDDDENKDTGDRCESLHLKCSENVGETESIENEVDEVTFGGYLADLDDTTSVDDLKSVGGDSFNNSLSSGLKIMLDTYSNGEETSETSSYNNDEEVHFQKADGSINANDIKPINAQTENEVERTEQKNLPQLETSINVISETNLESENCKGEINRHPSMEKIVNYTPEISSQESFSEKEHQNVSNEGNCEQDKEEPFVEGSDKEEILSSQDREKASSNNMNENADLIQMSPMEDSSDLNIVSKTQENEITPLDIDEGLPQQTTAEDEKMKINWKVGNLQVKLPHKTRGKAHLKAWKKRRVVIQPDEFANDPKNPSLVISVYGADSKKHETTFWYSVSSLKAVVFRSSSRTHRYAFTISEGNQAIIHMSAENESATQEWMAAIRAVLWPPSPFMELEKMLNGREFEVSIIDNEFSYHCGLLGMYGYLSITPKKLILLHPQQGYVIQEWYLNTVDKFQFLPQPKTQDAHKVLCMTTCSDSSTGQGDIIFFCNESVTLLQSLASNIHQVLSYHSKQEGGKYQKELEEIAEWLVAPPQDCLAAESNEHYKVPPRQVKSLLDIPNFIFNKSLSPVASAIYPAPNSEVIEPLDATRSKQTATSHDSGISICPSTDDILNCSIASFILGGGPMTSKSSDSELSDAYTPPRTPEVKKKPQCEIVDEEQTSTIED